jgi:hypothetical protein
MAGFHHREHVRDAFRRDEAPEKFERDAQQLRQHNVSLQASHRPQHKGHFLLQLNFLDTMPRQLPWLNNGGGGRTQVKQPPKSRAGTKAPSDIDDDFFDGTVLASSHKGKGKAARNDSDSEDDLPDLPTKSSTSYTKFRAGDVSCKKRVPSSSPPPIADLIQPQVEYMRKGVSKFDLRDDEWMMVEDEFLETAKLFTRHLHIAEYDKLKERIEAKKKEQVQAVKPVVAGGKLSVEETMKKKAEVQAKRQHKAIRDVFASQDDEDDEENAPTTTKLAGSSRTATSASKRPSVQASHDSDSDDLDASRPPRNCPIISKPVSASASILASSSTPGPKSASPATLMQKPASVTPSFAKPALPALRVRGARKSRFNVDMLDDYVPPANRTPIAEESKASTTPVRDTAYVFKTPVRSSLPVKPALDVRASGLSKETAERLAKRKAEREKERDGKKKSAKLEDIPTFLV